MQASPEAVRNGFLIAVFVTFIVFFGVRVLARQPLLNFLKDLKFWPSLSLMQFFSWTIVILFVFTWIYFVRLLSGVTDPPPGIPANILALMGISTGATVASAGVSRRYPREVSGKGQPWRTVFCEGESPSLGRLQMFAWTVIAILIYVYIVSSTLSGSRALASVELLGLPDIDPSLLVLMGFSQAGYVGSKAIATTPPQ